MYNVILTQYDGAILGPIAWVLGKIMNAIFIVLDAINIPNIGLAIIIFTIVIYLILTPLTYKQQKFSKLQQKMQPELQVIQAKYKGKKDSESVTKLNEETRAIYDKYGVSPTGSCVQPLIQMPILLALYRVINSMPGYVTKIGDTFRVLADKILSFGTSYPAAFLQNSKADSIATAVKTYGQALTNGTDVQNGIVDVLNKLSSTDLHNVANYYGLNNAEYNGQLIISQLGEKGEVLTRGLIDRYNHFLGLNIGDSPLNIIREAWSNANGIQIGLLIGAVLIPFLAAFTQWFNAKLMPQPANNDNKNGQKDTMASTMKSMNTIMPIMSAVFCLTLPAGMGIYWIAGAVVRSAQQVIINKRLDKEDINAIIEKNKEKAKKKAEKRNVNSQKLNEYAKMKTKNQSLSGSSSSGKSKAEKEEAYNKAMEKYSKSGSKPGSLASKANMVRDYNARNNKD